MSSSAAASAPQQPSRTSEPSMEEILASIRKIISDDQKVLEARLDPAQAAAPLAASPAGNDDQAADEEDVLELRPAVASMPAPVAAAPVAAPAIAAPASRQIAAPALEMPTAGALLSDASASATGAAFQSLANAVFTQNARTMDDLVKDMLRPMLKTWLDENLPSMVERLVRAEIERVARGGR